jgi:hypothetical protein
MRYWIIIPIALVAILIGSIAAKLLLNPLRRSDNDIRGWLLHQAPLGSTRQEVLVLVAKRGWKLHPEYRGRFINKSVPVGGFGAELGTCLGLVDVKVDAYWKFSVTDKLDEVYVNKWRESF